LLAAKVTVDAQNAQGLTPLMLAASKSRVAAARLLLQFHADPKKEDYTGRDATDWAGGNAMLKQSLKTAAGQ
jgi:ankyrin repeat protein